MAARIIASFVVASLLMSACASAAGDSDLTIDEPVDAPSTVTGRASAGVPITTVPPGGRQPDADDPLRVLFAGDSIGIEVAAPVFAALGGGGSALTYFVANPSIPRDELEQLFWAETVAEGDPEVVVILIGVWERMVFKQAGLDGQTLSEYRTEVMDPFVDLVTSQGAELVWVSSPLVEDPTASSQLEFMDAAFRGLGERDDRVEYIEAAGLVAGPDGEFIDVVTGPDGFAERVRRLDGTHLCPGGAVRMAEPLIDFVADRWNLPVSGDWPNGDWRYAQPFENGASECPAVG